MCCPSRWSSISCARFSRNSADRDTATRQVPAQTLEPGPECHLHGAHRDGRAERRRSAGDPQHIAELTSSRPALQPACVGTLLSSPFQGLGYESSNLGSGELADAVHVGWVRLPLSANVRQRSAPTHVVTAAFGLLEVGHIEPRLRDRASQSLKPLVGGGSCHICDRKLLRFQFPRPRLRICLRSPRFPIVPASWPGVAAMPWPSILPAGERQPPPTGLKDPEHLNSSWQRRAGVWQGSLVPASVGYNLLQPRIGGPAI